jgi:hypothetical protein
MLFLRLGQSALFASRFALSAVVFLRCQSFLAAAQRSAEWCGGVRAPGHQITRQIRAGRFLHRADCLAASGRSGWLLFADHAG